MSYTIADYLFEGPFTEMYEIVDGRAVYAILCRLGDSWKVLEVDWADAVRATIQDHPNRIRWGDRCFGGKLAYAIYYSAGRTDDELYDIVDEIRMRSQPVFMPEE